jgi:hypothetical protein
MPKSAVHCPADMHALKAINVLIQNKQFACTVTRNILEMAAGHGGEAVRK